MSQPTDTAELPERQPAGGVSAESASPNRRPPVALAVLLGLFALVASSTSIDPNDTWWHIRSGEYYLQHGTVPTTDVFSHTAAGREYFPHEWLSQVILYLTYHWFGFVGIRLLNTLMAIVSILLLWRFFAAATQRMLPVLFALAVIFPDFLSRMNTRPEIFTLPLFVAFLYFVLHRDRSRLPGWKTVLAVACLAAVWANLHGMALLGLIYLGAYTLGNAFALLGRRWLPFAEWRAVTVTGVLGDVILIGFYAAALLASPLGYRIYSHALQARDFLPGPLGIMEWLSPFQFLGGILHSFVTREFPWIDVALAWQFLFLAIPLAYFFSLPVLALGKRLPLPGEILIVLMALYQAATVVRFRWLFFILLFWIIRAMATPGPAGSTVRRQGSPLTAATLVGAPLMIMIMASGVYIMLSRGINFSQAVDASNYPVGIANYLEDAGLGGNLFNGYNWGGYLIFRLTPDYRVFIDGRTDLYALSDRNLMLDHVTIASQYQGYQKLLDSYDVDILIGSGKIYFPGAEYAEEIEYERRQKLQQMSGKAGLGTGSDGSSADGVGGPLRPAAAPLAWVPILINREGSVYLRNRPRNRSKLEALERFLASKQIPFTLEAGPDLATIISRHPQLAVRYGILSQDIIRGLIDSLDHPHSDAAIGHRVDFASALIGLEFFRDGIAILEQALEIDRYNNKSLMQIAFAYHLMGENQPASTYLQRSATVGRNQAAFAFLEHCRSHHPPASQRPPRLPPVEELADEWKISYR